MDPVLNGPELPPAFQSVVVSQTRPYYSTVQTLPVLAYSVADPGFVEGGMAAFWCTKFAGKLSN